MKVDGQKYAKISKYQPFYVREIIWESFHLQVDQKVTWDQAGIYSTYV